MPENICPTGDEILDYAIGELEDTRAQALEEHFAGCGSCAEKARQYIEADSRLKLLRADRIPKGLWSLQQGIRTSIPAAKAVSGPRKAFEKEIGDGEYKIRLLPYIGEDNSRLEIECRDKMRTGIILIDNGTRMLQLHMKDGQGAVEIDNGFSLEDLKIGFFSSGHI